MSTVELLDRTPPHSIDAERGIVASLLVDIHSLERIAGKVDSADFHNCEFGRLFEHLQNFPYQGNGDAEVDRPLFLEWLRSCYQGEDEKLGPVMADIWEKRSTASHIEHYADIVRQASSRRQLIASHCESLEHLYDPTANLAETIAGSQAALDTAGQTANGQDKFKGITAATMFAGCYPVKYLVENVFVEGQPLVVAGPRKSLKTSVLLDLGVSLAEGVPFLDRFQVPQPIRVGLLSGESGEATIRETFIRIADAKGIDPAKVDNLIIEATRVPRFNSAEDMAGLRRFIRRHRLQVVIVDPSAMAMPASDAGNLMAQYEILGRASRLCQDAGAGLILCHHMRKVLCGVTPTNPYPLPELEDVSWSGYQEWARSWLLLSRRERFEPGSGVHRLWLVTGGSVGHATETALDINEGDTDWCKVNGGRKWEVELAPIGQAREAAQDRRQAAREAQAEKTREVDRTAIVGAIHKLGHAETKSIIKTAAGVRSDRFGGAFASLIQDGTVVSTTIKKGRNQTYEAWELSYDE